MSWGSCSRTRRGPSPSGRAAAGHVAGTRLASRAAAGHAVACRAADHVVVGRVAASRAAGAEGCAPGTLSHPAPRPRTPGAPPSLAGLFQDE